MSPSAAGDGMARSGSMKRLTQAPNVAIATLWVDLLKRGHRGDACSAPTRAASPARSRPTRRCPRSGCSTTANTPTRNGCCTTCATCRTCTGSAGLARSGRRPVRAVLELRRLARQRRMTLTPRLALLMTLPPLLWAGNAVVGRLMVGQVPPLTLNLLRWLLTALILLPLAWRALRPPSRILQRWRYLLAVGVLGVGAFNSLQYLALVTSTPLNVTLVGVEHAGVDARRGRALLRRAPESAPVDRRGARPGRRAARDRPRLAADAARGAAGAGRPVHPGRRHRLGVLQLAARASAGAHAGRRSGRTGTGPASC